MPEDHNTDSATPLAAGVDRSGRDRSGRFTPGNRIGRGDPLGGRACRLRAVLLRTVTDNDLIEVVEALLTRAKSGDVQACREVLDRCIGRSVIPIVADLNEREFVETRVYFGPRLSREELAAEGVTVVGGPRDGRANG